jgi:hypothetical protein
MRRRALAVFLTTVLSLDANTGDSFDCIHDGHIHYDQDVWETLPPADAISMLKQQNIKRALVSATPAEGAEMLYRADPEIVIPMLRPYKSWRHRYLWFNDPDLETFLLNTWQEYPTGGLANFMCSARMQTLFRWKR